MAGRHHYDRQGTSALGKLNTSYTQAFATALAMGSLFGSAIPLGVSNTSGAQLLAAAKTSDQNAEPENTSNALVITAYNNADSAANNTDVALDEIAGSVSLDVEVELPKASLPTASNNSANVTYSAMPATGTRADMINFARQFQGVPYSWGHASPSGFDCSGLVSYVYANAGYSVPHSSASIIASGYQRVSAAEAQPGDILWWPGHVALYSGNGMIVHATPGKGVVEQPVYGSPTYLRVIN